MKFVRTIKGMPTLSAVVVKEDHLFVATCPELGTVSQGTTLDAAVANLKEATELYLEEVPLPKQFQRAVLTTFEVEHATQ